MYNNMEAAVEICNNMWEAEVAATCSSMGISPELVVEAICSSRLGEVANCTHMEEVGMAMEVEGICSSMGTSRELVVVGMEKVAVAIYSSMAEAAMVRAAEVICNSMAEGEMVTGVEVICTRMVEGEMVTGAEVICTRMVEAVMVMEAEVICSSREIPPQVEAAAETCIRIRVAEDDGLERVAEEIYTRMAAEEKRKLPFWSEIEA